MVKWIVVMKLQPSICLDDWVAMKKSQSGWLGPGPPKFESSMLPLRHLTRWRNFCFVE